MLGGVRLDAGYTAGMTIPQAFDSLIGKLIITGASRPAALARARRALAEFEVAGLPTVLPFHRAVVADPAFTSEPFAVISMSVGLLSAKLNTASGEPVATLHTAAPCLKYASGTSLAMLAV